MIVNFDPKSMQVHLMCGLGEKFEPTEKHKELQKKVEELRSKMVEWQEKIVNPGLQDIMKDVEELNKSFIDKKDE